MCKKIAIIALLSLFAVNAYSIGGLELTIKGGFTVPNDELGNIYNAETKSINGDIVTFNDLETATGYTIGLKAALPISDFLYGYAHAGIHQTGEEEYSLETLDGSQAYSFTASQFIIPVGVGAEIRFLEAAITDNYITGQLNFNYITSDVEIAAAQLQGDLNESTNDVRMGYGIGVGTDLDLKLIKANVELLYQALNPVLSEDQEDLKTLVSLTVGIVF